MSDAEFRGVWELIREQARARPTAIALSYHGTDLTYAELEQRSSELAAQLQDLGVAHEKIVALCLDRSPDLVIAMLAVVAARGAFVILDPAYPRSRLAFMLSDAHPTILVTHAGFQLDALPDGTIHHVLGGSTAARRPHADSRVSEHDLAYVVYTSGSTGRPKGALVEHRGLTNSLFEFNRVFGIGPESRVLQFASPSFDAAYQEIFSTLVAGATLVVAARERLLPGPGGLLELLRAERISVVTLPPTLLASVAVEPLPDLVTLISAGEACTREVVMKWAAPGRRFINAYGPSETSICATAGECTVGEQPGLGEPFANTELHILDDAFAHVDEGELYIGGRGVGRGYLNQPELTAQRFVPDPFSRQPDARLYRTGDLVRMRAGKLEFVGRADNQVKIRGFRIEPGEIENLLSRHPLVQQAIVVARTRPTGDTHLVAYVVTRESVDTRVLQDHLRSELPPHMVPSAVVVLAAFPLLPNGKVDRKALPEPDLHRGVYVTPRTANECLLAALWEEVLGVPWVSATDDFFALGGHSLRAMRIVHAIASRTGVSLSVEKLLGASTLERMAALVDAGAVERRDEPALVPLRIAEHGTPLFFVHPVNGSAYCFMELARALGDEISFYGFQSVVDVDAPLSPLETIATRYLAELRAVQPHGPYFLGGYSSGSIIAFEMSRQLELDGERVARLFVLDHEPIDEGWIAGVRKVVGDGKIEIDVGTAAFALVRNLSRCQHQRFGDPDWLAKFRSLPRAELAAEVMRQLYRLELLAPGTPDSEVMRVVRAVQTNLNGMVNYKMVRGSYPTTVLQTELGHPDDQTRPRGLRWDQHIDGEVEIRTVPGSHHTAVFPPHAEGLARVILEIVRRSLAATS